MSTKHLWKNVPEGVWCWHIHHTQLLELSTEPLKKRAKYILEEKPEDERKLRLQLMRPVLHPEKFPKQLIKARAKADKAYAELGKARAEVGKAYAEVDKARAELGKARAEWDKARAELGKAYAEVDKARAEVGKAYAEWNKEIEALHREECPNCPWDGGTIFPSTD